MWTLKQQPDKVPVEMLLYSCALVSSSLWIEKIGNENDLESSINLPLDNYSDYVGELSFSPHRVISCKRNKFFVNLITRALCVCINILKSQSQKIVLFQEPGETDIRKDCRKESKVSWGTFSQTFAIVTSNVIDEKETFFLPSLLNLFQPR